MAYIGEFENFLKKLIKEEEITTYSIRINKGKIKKDTKDEQIIRIKKGATLVLNPDLFGDGLIEHLKTNDKYIIEFSGGYMYNNCRLKKLEKSADFRKISGVCSSLIIDTINPLKDILLGYVENIVVPNNMIVAELNIHYEDGTASCKVEDKTKEKYQDELFNIIKAFVDSSKSTPQSEDYYPGDEESFDAPF